jgi:hypothetical protein
MHDHEAFERIPAVIRLRHDGRGGLAIKYLGWRHNGGKSRLSESMRGRLRGGLEGRPGWRLHNYFIEGKFYV